jgi:pimeloyl-ACP methyl ester carboxylesterase
MKTPLIFLPGLLCDDRLWRDQAAALADIADPLIADLTADDAIEAMAARVLETAPERFALAALSMGGYVAFEIMRQAPERVTRLALIDTSAAPDSPKRAAARRMALASLKAGRFLGVANRMLPQLIHERNLTTDIGQEVQAMAQRVGVKAYARQQSAILTRPDFQSVLSSIAIPALIGVGDSDVLTPPSDAERMRAAIKGARLHVFQACGHLPPMEAPEETSQVLRDWLTR